MSASPLVLFDGPCKLCHRAVRFILRHEKGPVLQFASLQSETGKANLAGYNLPPEIDAMVLIEDGEATYGSDAALRICRHLRYPWHLGYPLRHLPGFLHRPVYRWIARHRSRWFGMDESCPLPDPEKSERFLD